MDNRQIDLSRYRLQKAEESLEASEKLLEIKLYRDAINRSYYAGFYAVKAVLALNKVDFKRHKDVMAYFNKEYVAKGIFDKELGRKVGKLQQLRELSDYQDFFVASREQAQEQNQTAGSLIKAAKAYIEEITDNNAL